MTDPRDFDRDYTDRRLEIDSRMGAPTPWGWIAGAIFIIVVLALVFVGGNNTRTARMDENPPATTGAAPQTNMPAPPAGAPTTTGQAR